MSDDPATWTQCPECGMLVDPDELPCAHCYGCGWDEDEDEDG